jgi:hypothetical protein
VEKDQADGNCHYAAHNDQGQQCLPEGDERRGEGRKHYEHQHAGDQPAGGVPRWGVHGVFIQGFGNAVRNPFTPGIGIDSSLAPPNFGKDDGFVFRWFVDMSIGMAAIVGVASGDFQVL